MKKRHMILHAFVLGILNLCAVAIGFFLWKLLGGPQRNVQSFLSAVITFSVFWLWLKFAMSRGIPMAQGNGEALGFWLLSALILIAIFVPLHYFTQGYLTSWGNIEGLALLFIPVNFTAAILMLKMTGSDWPKLPDKK